MAKTKTEELVRSGWREIAGILVGMIGLMLLLGVLSYDPADIGVFRNEPGSHNWIGPFGARTAYACFMHFGVAGFVIPFCILWIGISSVFWSARKIYPRLLWFILALFCLAGLVDMNEQFWMSTVERLNIGTPGGLMGEVLAQRSLGFWIGHTGAGIVFFVLFFIAVVRMLDFHIVEFCKLVWEKIKTLKFEKPSVEEIFENKEPEVTVVKPRRKRASRKPNPEPAPVEKGAAVDIKALVEAQQKRPKKPAPKPKPVIAPTKVDIKSEPKKDEGEEGAFTKVLGNRSARL